MKLKKKAKEQYLRNPSRCPFCGTNNITASEGENVLPLKYVQQVKCLKCKEEWKDVFTLTDIFPEDEDD